MIVDPDLVVTLPILYAVPGVSPVFSIIICSGASLTSLIKAFTCFRCSRGSYVT